MNTSIKAATSRSLAVAAFVLLPAAQAMAQTTGTSHPEALDDMIATTPAAGSSHYVKPSPGTPSMTVTVATPPLALHEHASVDSTTVLVPASRHAEPATIIADDDNSGVVTEVHAAANELPVATVLKAELQESISTKATVAGTRFTAVLTSDAGHNGIVLLPAGSVIHGRVTQLHGGRRIGGAAAIRLQPDSITLPDGTNYALNAEVTDLAHFHDSHVNGEGSIVANSHPKATAAALGLTTGSAVVAGAMIGGGVGAVVGLGVGAGVGAVWWLKQDRQEMLPKDTEIAFSLDRSLFVGNTVR